MFLSNTPSSQKRFTRLHNFLHHFEFHRRNFFRRLTPVHWTALQPLPLSFRPPPINNLKTPWPLYRHPLPPCPIPSFPLHLDRVSYTYVAIPPTTAPYPFRTTASFTFTTTHNNPTSPVDPKSDVYAHGILLLELMIGKYAFELPFMVSSDMSKWVRSRMIWGASSITNMF